MSEPILQETGEALPAVLPPPSPPPPHPRLHPHSLKVGLKMGMPIYKIPPFNLKYDRLDPDYAKNTEYTILPKKMTRQINKLVSCGQYSLVEQRESGDS